MARVENETQRECSVKDQPDRRAFLAAAGTAAAVVAGMDSAASAAPPQPPPPVLPPGNNVSRVNQAKALRVSTANKSAAKGAPPHPDNGDEAIAGFLGNYSKGLPHDELGVVDPKAYLSLRQALKSGNPQQFENLPLAGDRKLVNPLAGLAFDFVGLDSHQFAQPPAPALASAEAASEMVELYWMALMRDVPFSQYASSDLAQFACAELSSLPAFRGPRDGVDVTPELLFRGSTAGDRVGPCISQFLLRDFLYGSILMSHRMQTVDPGDYLTDFDSWLLAQNGVSPAGGPVISDAPCYLRSLRDLSHYVHVDALAEAYFNAALILLGMGAPLNPGNPYVDSATMVGFGTFGGPHILALVNAVSTHALHAVWFQKWFVHRRLRPEAFGGLVQLKIDGTLNAPLHASVMDSAAVAATQDAFSSALLPQAFPEGSPLHPSYGAGHATVAGACVTVLKAMFDGTWVLPEAFVASDDGSQLLDYEGDELTVGGELDKLAANIAIGRNAAGVHYRSDYFESLKLGEQVAVHLLKQLKPSYREASDLEFTGFDGGTISI